MRPGLRALVFAAGLVLAGCESGNERKNDAGPPIELNPKGPGAMKSPDEGGGAGVPKGMEKGKK
ncbi:MAG: hypothetical protein K2V38_10385 [Gemmataceae bacterium]|nr:hypothetical protein [Gemmataceae bacterium]